MSQVTDPKAELFLSGMDRWLTSAASRSLEILSGFFLFGAVVFLVLS